MGNLIRVAAVAALLGGVVWIAGCSTSGGLSGNSIIITPPSSLLMPGGGQAFTSNMPVGWSVTELDGGGITPSGFYTAPVTPGTYHVVATRLDDTSKKATATITVASGGTVAGLTATPMADAVLQGYPDGANLLRWPFLSDRVIAWFIYRDTNLLAPIAVIPGSLLDYEDSASPLPQFGTAMETVDVDIAIDPQTGRVVNFDLNTTYEPSLLNLHNSEMSLGAQTLHLACHRVPLAPGEICGYRIQVLYEEYDVGNLNDPGGFPDAYRLYLGNQSGTTDRVTLTAPPELLSPAGGQFPPDGVYRATQSPDAWSYIIQVSSTSSFSPTTLFVANATPNGASVEAAIDPNALFNRFASFAGRTLYWRIGARVDTGPHPAPLTDPNQSGWVFSELRFFTLPEFPPGPG